MRGRGAAWALKITPHGSYLAIPELGHGLGAAPCKTSSLPGSSPDTGQLTCQRRMGEREQSGNAAVTEVHVTPETVESHFHSHWTTCRKTAASITARTLQPCFNNNCGHRTYSFQHSAVTTFSLLDCLSEESVILPLRIGANQSDKVAISWKMLFCS